MSAADSRHRTGTALGRAVFATALLLALARAPAIAQDDALPAADAPAVAEASAPAAEPASDATKAAPADPADTPAEPLPAFPVKAWNRPIAGMSVGYLGAPPATRARNAGARLDTWLEDADAPDPVAALTTVEGRTGVVVTAGTTVLFGLLPADVGQGEPVDDATLLAEGERVVAALKAVREERRAFDAPGRLLRAIAVSIALAAGAFALWYFGSRLYHRLRERLQARAAVRAEVLRAGGYDFKPLLYGVIERLAGAIWLVLALAIGYLWLGFTLKQFPYTRPWGDTLGGYLWTAAGGLLTGFIDEIPSLLTLLLIWLIAHAISRVVRDWFEAIRVGVVQVDWCDPTAAVVSARLAQLFVWLFALTIAYPYIPGADTPAFQGLSVLLGLMVSIGSAGVIGQIVSGIVAVYTKAIRIGDMVRVGEIEGTVTSMGVLSLKIANRLNEEFTVPNAMLSSAPVQNYSRLSGDKGLILQTSVTIGYDAPWRQIHAMLLLAAARTPNLLREPKPVVLQKALSDFYVEYTLLVSVSVPQTKVFALSALHANIQDAFNEYGVQIMSPNFEAQPEEKVWVPKERWHEAPAAAVDAPEPLDGRALGGGD